MTEQVWPWREHLDPFERARARLLDQEIAKIDAERPDLVAEANRIKQKIIRMDRKRVELAAERQSLVARGRHRARCCKNRLMPSKSALSSPSSTSSHERIP